MEEEIAPTSELRLLSERVLEAIAATEWGRGFKPSSGGEGRAGSCLVWTAFSGAPKEKIINEMISFVHSTDKNSSSSLCQAKPHTSVRLALIYIWSSGSAPICWIFFFYR